MKARFGIAGALATAALLVAPSVANAGGLAIVPDKACYRSGEQPVLGGFGFTPNSTVSLMVDGLVIRNKSTGQPAHAPTDAAGNLAPPGNLLLARRHGQGLRTYTATDDSNPANTGSAKLLVSALTVTLKPKAGPPDRRFRIGARGFTTGKRLYAHVINKKTHRVLRTVGVGRLKGACHTIKSRRRLFPHSVATGRYRIQFDSKRKFSKKTKVRVSRLFRVTRHIG